MACSRNPTGHNRHSQPKRRRGARALSQWPALHRTAYRQVEVVIVDNGSTEPAVLDRRLYARRERTRAHDPIRFSDSFNFFGGLYRGRRPRMQASCSSKSKIDVEVIEPDWLEELIGWAQSRWSRCRWRQTSISEFTRFSTRGARVWFWASRRSHFLEAPSRKCDRRVPQAQTRRLRAESSDSDIGVWRQRHRLQGAAPSGSAPPASPAR